MTDAADVQTAVDRLAVAVNQSVLIEDRAQLPVWWSTQGAVDATRSATILQRRVAPKAAAVVRQYKLGQATAPVRTPAIPDAGMWARWCMPVRADRRLLGYLWVLDPDESLRASDLPRLVECAGLAADVMASSERSDERQRRRRDDFVARLLRGPDDAAARGLARLERVPDDTGIQVDAPARANGWRLPDGLSAQVVRTRPRIAASGAPVPLVDLSEAVRRAVATRRALAAGAVLEPASWDGLGAWRLIVDAPATLTPADLHPAAEILAAEQQADLLITARVVLDHGADVAAAAATLHVHRTTLYYRLDRIQHLTGIDLRADRSRTDLQLALWLAAYRAAP